MAQEILSMLLLAFVSLFHSILQTLQSNILWVFFLHSRASFVPAASAYSCADLNS
ncbi:hypothetical protein AB4K20DRAFT_1070887 [Rhizopus microsporus]